MCYNNFRSRKVHSPCPLRFPTYGHQTIWLNKKLKNKKVKKRKIKRRIQMNNFKINGIPEIKTDIKPKQRDFNMHIHDDYEIFCFLSGDAKYVVEGSVYPLHKGDFILINRFESHHLMLLSDKVYTRILVNFSPLKPESSLAKKLILPFEGRAFGKLNRYPHSVFSNSLPLHYLEKISESKNENIQSAYLTVMLNEIAENFEYLKTHKISAENNICADILHYINRHLTDSLSLNLLSERFFISKSQLNRNFKHIMGSTVWEYITEKRLLLAKELIEKGTNPTKAYIDCGFKDYSAFYRAYRSKFNISPSNEKGKNRENK